MKKKFKLHCDASDKAEGVLLCQDDENGDEVIIGVASKLFKNH